MIGRENLRDRATPKDCWQMWVGTPGGCDSLFTQNHGNLKTRFCYNPLHPHVHAGVNCAQTEEELDAIIGHIEAALKARKQRNTTDEVRNTAG